jgi:glycine dehydrogenase subunit 1
LDFLPHTQRDIEAMLDRIGVGSIDDLFEAVPEGSRFTGDLDVPPSLSEPELISHLARLSKKNKGASDLVCFAGGGAYDHHVPPAVRSLASRAEFATSYTPYQPELSQGVLQAIYEFQTLICEIYGLEVANASLYDGASALAEAANLAARVTKRDRVVIGESVHPHYTEVLRTWTSGLGTQIDVAPFDRSTGVVDWSSVDLQDAGAVVVGYPNVFGRLEDLGTAAAAATAVGALSISVTDPTAMGVLKPPGAHGADVAVGEGHALGNPMSYGGPYVGLFSTKLQHVRQVPGRIAGETLDADGRRAFVLTLQAREQHIRRAKATSNVCTNQTLMAIAAAIQLSWLGPEGLRRLGEICLERAHRAAARLAQIPRCEVRFEGPFYKEFVLRVPAPAEQVAAALAGEGFLVGPALGRWYEDLDDCLLIAATEKRTTEDIERLAEALEKELAGR